MGEIEVLRRIWAGLPRVPVVEERLLRESLLKSAVYSARIEGIAATEKSPRLEAQNLLAEYKRVFSGKEGGWFTSELVKKIHAHVMKNLSGGGGKYRSEPGAIFNQAGVAIHVAPPHFKVSGMMEDYVEYISGLEAHPVETAAVAQFVLEKIHPFADGNGRVGRLVSAFWLQKFQYDFGGLLRLEEYMEKNREDYYRALEPPHDMTAFVEFVVEGVAWQASAAVELVRSADVVEQAALLLRREEMLAIIRDHPRCTFDFISRRFSAVNPKTLHYDLLWLLQKKLVRKLGVTRGVVYEAV